MKLHRIAAGTSVNAIAGMVLCHDLDAGGHRMRKGQILSPDDVALIGATAPSELHLIELGPGDLHEGDAGRRLADAAAGDGVDVLDPSAGHWPLVATRRGILDVSVDALRRANELDGISIYTLFHGQIVDAAEHVARAKVAPLALEERLVGEAEAVARSASGVLRVRPFLPRRIGAAVVESLGAKSMSRFRDALAEKVAWFGSTMLEPAFVPPDEHTLSDAMRGLIAAGAEVLTLAGTKAMDPLDPSWLALQRLGVKIERFGVPAHPGSLFWIAWHGDIPILGMPTCGLFTQATVFDLVLPRILAGEHVGRAELAELGHGGFLTRELAFRFPRYRGNVERGAVEED